MDDIWSILELEPTQDVETIRGAYARQTHKYHPEEDPDGFLRLRQAYQAALAQARGAAPAPASPPEQDRDAEEQTAPGADQEDAGWVLPDLPPEEGPNPFQDHPAFLQFVELYTGKRRKDAKAWMDYVTSEPFLDAAWESSFPALLLAKGTELERELPPTREFLTWLSVAYQYTITKSVYLDREEYHISHPHEADFDGMLLIKRLALKGPLPKRPTGNELSIRASFQEYRHLVKLAQLGIWDEQTLREFDHTVRRYDSAYLKDNCDPKGNMEHQRHPAGLRVLTHFFRRTDLPQELYRTVWQQLGLKSAIMGRAKLFYGPLRELVVERVPDIEQSKTESFLQLNRDYRAYRDRNRILMSSRLESDWEKAREETDAFFVREDFQQALRVRRFVENQLLLSWLNTAWCGEYFQQRLLDFYRENPDIPGACQVVLRLEQMIQDHAVHLRNVQDTSAPVPEVLTLSDRPFFRHWLNTGFYPARDPETGAPLLQYLTQFPLLPEWSRQLLGAEEGEIPVPRQVVYTNGEDEISICFHLRYMSFQLNKEPIYRPMLDWDWLVTLPEGDMFFFLLPLALSVYSQYEAVRTELLRRLETTAAPAEDRAVIAGMLAGHVCRLPVRENGDWADPEDIFPLELFAEDSDHLYGCSWFRDEGELVLFVQTPSGRSGLRDGEYSKVWDEETALALARQQLEELVSPSGFHVELLNPLPEAVYLDPDFMAIARDPERRGQNLPRSLLRDAVTAESLETLLLLFAQGAIRRLELSWNAFIPWDHDCPSRRSLVFLKDKAGFACLVFDDTRAKSFALLSRPEQYRNLESDQVEYLPFRQSELACYNVHVSFTSIQRRLDEVFRQIVLPQGVDILGSFLWSYTYRTDHGRHKYNIDKQLLGGFPPERARNRLTAKIYLSLYPDMAVYTDNQEEREELSVGRQNRDRLRHALLRMFQGDLSRLRMTWGTQSGSQRHIFILRDGERFLLAHLDDSRERAEFHVADVSTYINVEGKKYPKDTFLGRTTPAYLIHLGAADLRNALELLLANMEHPKIILDEFAAYAFENPVKPRPYSAIRAELVEED